MIVEVPDTSTMEALGARLTVDCEPGLSFFLRGALGAGKTTLTRGFLRALGHQGPVRSPTYTLVEPYEMTAVNVYHFDLYRLSDPEELEFMGVRDYFRGDAICLVEWPERALDRLPRPDVDVAIATIADGPAHGRRVTLHALTPAGVFALTRISAHKS